MRLVVGLGNPGEKFEKTRHNVGFMVVDKLALEISKSKFLNPKQVQNSNFKFDKKMPCYLLQTANFLLAKPTSFMNSSGIVVKKLVEHYKVNPSNLWVIHDDLDLRLSEYKIQFGKGPKLHYGVLSIEKSLVTKDFWRVRIGVDNRQLGEKVLGEEYVLEEFTHQEQEIIQNVIDEVVEKLLQRLE